MNDGSLKPDSDELDVAIADSLNRSFQPPQFDAGSFSWSPQNSVNTVSLPGPLFAALFAAAIGIAGIAGFMLYSNANSPKPAGLDVVNPLDVDEYKFECEVSVDVFDEPEGK